MHAYAWSRVAEQAHAATREGGAAHIKDRGLGVGAPLRMQVRGRLELDGVVATVAAPRRRVDALERVHELLLEGARCAPRL